MQRLYFVLTTIFTALMMGCATSANAQPQETTAPATSTAVNCPVTLPESSTFEAPAPFSPTAPFGGEFWYGSEDLWTALPQNAMWSDLPHNSEGYTQKIFWWSKHFSLKDEPEPDLDVFGKRLDKEAPPLIVSKATNASASDIGSAMRVGVDFPAEGCWEITGRYKNTELSFTIWVEP